MIMATLQDWWFATGIKKVNTGILRYLCHVQNLKSREIYCLVR